MGGHILIDEDDTVTVNARHTVISCLHGVDVPYFYRIIPCFCILLGISHCRQGKHAHDGQNNFLHTEFLIFYFSVIHNF